MVTKLPSRNIIVPHRRLELSEADHKRQISKGLYIVERGERFAVPVDRKSDVTRFKDRELWAALPDGSVGRPGVMLRERTFAFQGKALAWARDHLHRDIPYWYYMATLGHDIHVSQRANLYARHWHNGWANPLTGELDQPIDGTFNALRETHFVDHECDLPACPKDVWGSWDAALSVLSGLRGFTENLGLLSSAKITDVFVNVEVGALTDSAGSGEAAEFNDFNEHEVGTGVTAESNNDTALVTSSGIALQAGTQVDDGGDPPTYTTVATITADATETWEEHGVFSTTVDSLMDRSLTGGQSVNASDQVQYTYTATINPEA